MADQRVRLLVIGYGNTLRSDDGAGPAVAERVSELNLPGVKVITCDLLAPELADPVSKADSVIFVDASIDTPPEAGILLRDLLPAESSQILAHSADPRTLLALSRDIFGHVPRAWWLTIPARELGIGESFSATARAGVEAAVEKVTAMAAIR